LDSFPKISNLMADIEIRALYRKSLRSLSIRVLAFLPQLRRIQLRDKSLGVEPDVPWLWYVLTNVGSDILNKFAYFSKGEPDLFINLPVTMALRVKLHYLANPNLKPIILSLEGSVAPATRTCGSLGIAALQFSLHGLSPRMKVSPYREASDASHKNKNLNELAFYIDRGLKA